MICEDICRLFPQKMIINRKVNGCKPPSEREVAFSQENDGRSLRVRMKSAHFMAGAVLKYRGLLPVPRLYAARPSSQRRAQKRICNLIVFLLGRSLNLSFASQKSMKSMDKKSCVTTQKSLPLEGKGDRASGG